jgi:hypothetical protein
VLLLRSQLQSSISFLYIFYCFAGLGYIVACTKFLQCIKYIILGFTPSPALLYLPLPHFWNSFNRYYFCIYLHVYTILAPLKLPNNFHCLCFSVVLLGCGVFSVFTFSEWQTFNLLDVLYQFWIMLTFIS